MRLTLARCASFLLRARPGRTAGLAALGLERHLAAHLLALTCDDADDVQKVTMGSHVAAGEGAETTPMKETFCSSSCCVLVLHRGATRQQTRQQR